MKILYYTGWTFTRVISKLIFRIRTYGQEHFPAEGGFILATNHISNFDPPLVGSWAPRQCYFMAKRELFRNPLFGEIIRRTNAMPVSRGGVDREAIRTAVKVIQDGYGLVMFPEGTRSKTGEFLSPKAGLGMIARRAGCPILPGYLQGSDRLADSFWGRRPMRLLYGEMFPADWVKAQSADKEGYQLISRTVMDRIGELREQLAQLK